jgi:hypothetical protein
LRGRREWDIPAAIAIDQIRGDPMKDHHDEYIYTRDHRTPAQRRAANREAFIGWISLISFTTATFVLADIFLVH